tara:strand:+ start:256 stop:1059 length:804 start_codon:yes stop_codon:yes gene_type:complete
MFLEAELHLAYKIANTPILNFPFPHLYVENIFPTDFYSKIQENLLEIKDMKSLPNSDTANYGLSGYKDRFMMNLAKKDEMSKVKKDNQEFLRVFGEMFTKGDFSKLLQAKFKKFLDMRFQYVENVSFYDEVRLFNDKKNYALGPHTDKPSKVISILFYLPKDQKQKETGTSIYMPKDPNKLNKELPHIHYPHEDFHKVTTVPFVPNSAFCFIKTNNSFHGVEKLEMKDTDRWSLQYNLYITEETLNQETAAKNKHLKAQEAKSNFSI